MIWREKLTPGGVFAGRKFWFVTSLTCAGISRHIYLVKYARTRYTTFALWRGWAKRDGDAMGAVFCSRVGK